MKVKAKTAYLGIFGLIAYILYKDTNEEEGESIIKKTVAKIENTSNQFLYYGLIGGTQEIANIINNVCIVISPNTATNAKLLLAETVAVESNNGQAKDYGKSYGEGLTQFDKGTFEYIKEYYKTKKYDTLYNNILSDLKIDIRIANYSDLRKSPLLSIIYARLLYLKVPFAIPSTKQGRWEYYKKWYNSSLGATTQAKYYDASIVAVYV